MRFLLVIFHIVTVLSSGSGDARISNMSIDEKMQTYHLEKKDIEIVINKTAHTLKLRAGSIDLKKYKCVFGGNPRDDKKCQGDQCTPEGEFHIQAVYPNHQWDKFMLLDYPTKRSWDQFQYNKAHGHVPANASIGGSIGIHGVPDGKGYLISRGINWTLGCISLSNADIDEIYRYVDVGTRVMIVK
jgi:murein L,D-transpeptidase YafK